MSSSTQTSAKINELEKSLKALSKEVAGDEILRKRLLGIVQEQAATLDSPIDFIWRMIMEPHQSSSLRTAQEMGIIDALGDSSDPKSSTELASITKGDKQLIVRIMRPLTALKIVDEVSCETYAANAISKLLTIPAVGGGFKFMFDEAATSVIHMPTFLSRTSYQNPQGPNGCFQSAFNTNLQLFSWLMAHPDQMSNFNNLMVGQKMSRVDWHTFVDVNSMLLSGSNPSPDSTLLVDVGGGRGGDLAEFKKAFPEAKGKLVVQDLPQVIADITDLDGEIVRMPHDFFTAQPVKDARAYYLRYILHDYSDAKCREILGHLASAMKQGYSKVLIFENVLPETGTPLASALLDINMIALLSGMERTAKQWRELLGSVGLDVVKIWEQEGNIEGVVEAVLKS